MKKLFFLLVLSTTACGVITTPPTEIHFSPSLTQAVPVIGGQETATPAQEVPVKFEIASSAFENGQPIPKEFSCKGNDTSPELSWTEPPAGTQSFALIMDDPDAPMGTWVHWVIFNIPASSRGLSAGLPTEANLSDGSVQGVTSAGSNGYHGPCPPSGTHRYFFKLYALDAMLSLKSNADKKFLLAAMEGHILASAELMGTFSH